MFAAGLTAVVLFSFAAVLTGDHDLESSFSAHAPQYFSIIVTPLPTSKCASTVARLPHVEQYFSFFSFGPGMNGFLLIRDFTIGPHSMPAGRVKIPDKPIMAATIMKLLVLIISS